MIGEFKGITKQVHQNLFDSLGVRIDHLRDFVLNKLLQLDVLKLALPLKQNDHVVQKLTYVEVFIFEAKFIIVIELCKVLNVLNH